jgi:hypothetical protein
VSFKRAEVAEIGEFLIISAKSSCILSPSEGISGFPGQEILVQVPDYCEVRAYLITLQLSSIAAFTSL